DDAALFGKALAGLLDDRREVREVGSGATLAGEFDRLQLEQVAHLHRMDDGVAIERQPVVAAQHHALEARVRVRAGQVDARVRLAGDQPQRLERGQRLAQRRAAHVQLRREVALGRQPVARREAVLLDEAQHLAGDRGLGVRQRQRAGSTGLRRAAIGSGWIAPYGHATRNDVFGPIDSTPRFAASSASFRAAPHAVDTTNGAALASKRQLVRPLGARPVRPSTPEEAFVGAAGAVRAGYPATARTEDTARSRSEPAEGAGGATFREARLIPRRK